MSKITIYTCLIGNYSALRSPPAELLSEYEFFVFSDAPISITGWQTKHFDTSPEESNRRKAKKPKIQPWNYIDTDISVWVDANMVIRPEAFKETIAEFLSSEKSIGLFRHNKRKHLNAEFKDVIDKLKDDTKLLARQRDTYKNLPNYERLPLYQGGVIFRRHRCPNLERAMRDWQSEVNSFSARDQLSLPVVLEPIAADDLFIFPNKTINDIGQLMPHLKYENEPGFRSFHEKVKWWVIKGAYLLLTSRFIMKIKQRIKRSV